jgi:hypothetical protein
MAIQQQAHIQGKVNWKLHYVYGTMVRAHQHAAGARGKTPEEALDRSQDGFSTKVHLRADGEAS